MIVFLCTFFLLTNNLLAEVFLYKTDKNENIYATSSSFYSDMDHFAFIYLKGFQQIANLKAEVDIYGTATITLAIKSFLLKEYFIKDHVKYESANDLRRLCEQAINYLIAKLQKESVIYHDFLGHISEEDESPQDRKKLHRHRQRRSYDHMHMSKMMKLNIYRDDNIENILYKMELFNKKNYKSDEKYLTNLLCIIKEFPKPFNYNHWLALPSCFNQEAD